MSRPRQSRNGELLCLHRQCHPLTRTGIVIRGAGFNRQAAALQTRLRREHIAVLGVLRCPPSRALPALRACLRRMPDRSIAANIAGPCHIPAANRPVASKVHIGPTVAIERRDGGLFGVFERISKGQSTATGAVLAHRRALSVSTDFSRGKKKKKKKQRARRASLSTPRFNVALSGPKVSSPTVI